MLLMLKLAKVMMWHEEAAVAEAIRTHVFQGSTDPYEFNKKQFEGSIKTVTKTLSAPRSELKQSLEIIKRESEEMKRVEKERMDAMFGGRVSRPFTATNIKGVEINPSGIYASINDILTLRMEKNNDALERRHFQVHEDVMRLGQGIFEHSLRRIKITLQLIKKYNDAP